MIKVLIADDDEGMRLVLKKVIEKYEDFEIVGEAADGEAALHMFEKNKPQVVFLDVEMPKLDGIGCAKAILDINPKAFIIFATAHEEYMPNAFEIYACDFLVKPFKLDRIKQTLMRIKNIHSPQEIRFPNQDVDLMKLIVKNKEGINFINMKDIVLIQRENGNTVIYTAFDKFSTSEGLSELEERLDKRFFFRSHKSYIINLTMINKIYPYGRWTYIVKFKNTEMDALLTYEHYEELEKLFR